MRQCQTKLRFARSFNGCTTLLGAANVRVLICSPTLEPAPY